MIADTIGFSRMEIQFQPTIERNSPKLKLRRLKHGGIPIQKWLFQQPGKTSSALRLASKRKACRNQQTHDGQNRDG